MNENEELDPIEAEHKRIISDLCERAKKVKFNYCKGEDKAVITKRERIHDAFNESLTIWTTMHKLKKDGKFDRALFSGHLFIRLVLTEGLHKKKESDLKVISEKMLERLMAIEGLMKEISEGIKSQIKLRVEQEGERKIKMAQEKEEKERELQKQNEEERERRRKEKKERKRERDKPKDGYEVLSLDDYEVKIIAGDGHCAFRSVVQGEGMGKLKSSEETKKALEMRRKVCEDMKEKRGKVVEMLGLTVEKIVTMDGRHKTLESYLKGMRKSDYAGEIELILMAQRVGRPVFVYKREGNKFKRIQKYLTEGYPICILWQQGMTEGGNHYNLLLQKQNPKNMIL